MKLINRPEYESIIHEVARRFPINIIDDVPSLSIQRDESKLMYADILLCDLFELVILNKNKFIQFVVHKLQKFSGLSFRSQDEFPPGEEPDEDDYDDKERSIGYPKNFLIMHMIEFFILNKKPNILDNYLKFVRMSYAKKYASDLREIYASITC